MKKLLTIDGCCAVLALHHVSGIDEETVLRICTLRNFKPKKGMADKDWKAAADDLGIKIRGLIMEPCRLKRFVEDHPTGLWLLGTHDHLFVLDNNVIVDPREKQRGKYPGLRRVIKQAWRVEKLTGR